MLAFVAAQLLLTSCLGEANTIVNLDDATTSCSGVCKADLYEDTSYAANQFEQVRSVSMLQSGLNARKDHGSQDVYAYVEKLVQEQGQRGVVMPHGEETSQQTQTAWAKLMAFQVQRHRHRAHGLDDNATAANGTQTAARASGVAANAPGDLSLLLAAIATNGGFVVFCVILFSVILHPYFPLVYKQKVRQVGLRDETPTSAALASVASRLPAHGPAPEEVSSSTFGWLFASLQLTVADVAVHAGLDHAMFIEFTNFAMRTMLLLGLGIIPVLCPLTYLYGGNAAGNDKLGKIGFANVAAGSWVCWPVAASVWYVVIVVELQVFRAMRSFMPRRFKWLREMPAPRATTVLLEDLPGDKMRESEIRRYFDEHVFGHEAVKEVYLVKDLSELTYWTEKLEQLRLDLERDQATGTTSAQKLLMNGRDTTLAMHIREVEQQVAKLQADMDCDEELHTSTAFVSFHGPREALVVLKIFGASGEEEFIASIPPSPEDVIWKDFLVNPDAQRFREVAGYALIAVLFFALTPIVISISTFTSLASLSQYFPSITENIQQNKRLAELWEGVMGSFALSLVMGLLPASLGLIFCSCFVLKATAWLQLRIQQFYFYFLVSFVLLVSAIAAGVWQTLEELAQNPLGVFALLASTLPNYTHFYLSYFATQWMTEALALMRLANLFKYITLSRIFERERARELSEPEDQYSFGIGTRSAKVTFLFVAALVFCTLSPLISVLALVEFAICRVFYGYLFVYAETTKPDLGGEFFVTSLKHVQQGMHLYVMLMTGVLLKQGPTVYPGIVAGTSLVVTYLARERLQRRFRWECLEFNEVEEALSEDDPKPKRRSRRSNYKQPELPPPPPPPPPEPPRPPPPPSSAMHTMHANMQQGLEDVYKRLEAATSRTLWSGSAQPQPKPGKGSSKGKGKPLPLVPNDPFVAPAGGGALGPGGARSPRSRMVCC